MNRNRLRLVMSVARGALLTVITAGNVYAQAPATPPPDVRLRGEQQERLQQGRDETQRRQLQASPNTLKRTHSFLNTTHTWQMGSYDWTNPDISEVIGLVGGTLSGAQQLSITAQSLSNTDLARTTAQPTGGLGFLGTTGPITVPNSAMFQPANAGSRYLIESDPRFTDYRQWLGSDYMFAALGSDPNALQKRLGDGFYEQRLVREQVGQLTGRRFLEGHASDEAQFQALMDAGITYAQAHQLVPGVALSAEQMAQLTTDLVWLVEREVVLPDGSKTTALVPQVYVRQVPQGGRTKRSQNDVKSFSGFSNACCVKGVSSCTRRACSLIRPLRSRSRRFGGHGQKVISPIQRIQTQTSTCGSLIWPAPLV